MILAGEKRTKSDDGWLTAINKIYHRNFVGLISAKNCSDAKWRAQHGGVIFFFLKFIRWESYKMSPLNRLTAMATYMSPLFFELRDRLITFLVFVRCQRLIARNDRELFSSNCGVSHLRLFNLKRRVLHLAGTKNSSWTDRCQKIGRFEIKRFRVLTTVISMKCAVLSDC